MEGSINRGNRKLFAHYSSSKDKKMQKLEFIHKEVVSCARGEGIILISCH